MVLFIARPVSAGNRYCWYSNLDQKEYCPKWEREELYYNFDEDLEYKDEIIKAWKKQTKDVFHDKFKLIDNGGTNQVARIEVRYIGGFNGNKIAKTNIVPVRDQIGNVIISVLDKYKAGSYTGSAYKDLLEALMHELGHIFGADHSDPFISKNTKMLSSKDQPLMNQDGNFLGDIEFRYDDKEVLWEIYGLKRKYTNKVQIISECQFQNIFLVNLDVPEYSISKHGAELNTVFNNVMPGRYNIGVRFNKADEWNFICQESGIGYKLCKKPAVIQIQKGKKIRIN